MQPCSQIQMQDTSEEDKNLSFLFDDPPFTPLEIIPKNNLNEFDTYLQDNSQDLVDLNYDILSPRSRKLFLRELNRDFHLSLQADILITNATDRLRRIEDIVKRSLIGWKMKADTFQKLISPQDYQLLKTLGCHEKLKEIFEITQAYLGTLIKKYYPPIEPPLALKVLNILILEKLADPRLSRKKNLSQAKVNTFLLLDKKILRILKNYYQNYTKLCKVFSLDESLFKDTLDANPNIKRFLQNTYRKSTVNQNTFVKPEPFAQSNREFTIPRLLPLNDSFKIPYTLERYPTLPTSETNNQRGENNIPNPQRAYPTFFSPQLAAQPALIKLQSDKPSDVSNGPLAPKQS